MEESFKLDGSNGSLENVPDRSLNFSHDLHLNSTLANISDDVVHESSSKIYWALLLIPLPLVAVVGNILVILSVYRERSLQTVTNYFIVSLAFADLLVAAVVMPFAVYVLASQVNVDWELSDTLCDFYIAVDVTCSTASIFNLVAISVDRYIAVTQPIKYSKHKNSKRVIISIAIVWLVSAAIGSPIVLGLNTSPERIPELCVFYNSDFIIYSSLSSFYIPCIVMVYLYYKIFKAIHARARKIKARARTSNSTTCGKSTGSTSLSTDPSNLRMGTMGGLKVVVERDGLTTGTGSGSQEDDADDDTINDESSEPVKVTGASAMLLSAFMTQTIRIEIPVNGNADSGYGTSHVDPDGPTGAVAEDFASVLLDPLDEGDGNRLGVPAVRRNGSAGGDGKERKSRFNLGRRNKNRKKREKASAKKERKATKTLAIVLGMFLMCWVPFFTCNILDAICIKMESDTYRPGVTIFLLTTWLGYINSCVNPVIYTIFNMEFRKAFKKLLRESWTCC